MPGKVIRYAILASTTPQILSLTQQDEFKTYSRLYGVDTSKSSALELLNKFLVYHHVSHEAMDEFFQYHPAKHGCWCPTLTESSKYKALKGHPSLSLLPNSSTKLDHNSLDKHCQIHSQCKTCIHNSMSLSVTDKSFKYYSVEFTADTTDPTNLLKTKIICNPGQYLPGENNWVDSLYYEEICQCDTEFVKGVIRNFVANRKPDLKFEGFCRDVNVSEYFKNLYESKFRELEDVAGKSQEVFNQSKVTTTEGSTTESSTAIPSETTSIETTTEIEASPTFDPNQTVEQLYNQLSQHHYDLKAAMSHDSPVYYDIYENNDQYYEYPNYDTQTNYNVDGYNDIIYVVDEYENVINDLFGNIEVVHTTEETDVSITSTKASSTTVSTPSTTTTTTTDKPTPTTSTTTTQAPTTSPFIDHSKKLCCKNADNIWLKYHPESSPPIDCIKYT